MFKTTAIKSLKDRPYLFINLTFAFFPISLILGSLIVNLNLLLFCSLGIYYLISKNLKFKFDFATKVIFLFFLVVFFSTSLSFIKSLLIEDYNSSNLTRFIKSILLLRFFLLLLIINILNKFDILNFNFFFIVAGCSSFLISLDIIYQYIFGFNIIGLKGLDTHNSGFFGDELIAGGYIQRFGFFALFLIIFLFKNSKYNKFIFSVISISILTTAILFSGNRMSLVLFLFGLILILFFKIKLKKIIFISFLTIFIILQFAILSNEKYKFYVQGQYHSLYESVKSILPFAPKELTKWKWTGRGEPPMNSEDTNSGEELQTKTYFFKVEYETPHRRILNTAIETWKKNKIFGNGIKSFREDCWKLEGDPDVYLGENLMPDKKNLLCSNHPHNYYFEVLTDTGIIGILNVVTILIIFAIFLFKNFKYLNKVNFKNLIVLSSIISLILEIMPLRSTGSLFTTNNLTYIIIISSIVLCHKQLLRSKT